MIAMVSAVATTSTTPPTRTVVGMPMNEPSTPTVTPENDLIPGPNIEYEPITRPR